MVADGQNFRPSLLGRVGGGYARRLGEVLQEAEGLSAQSLHDALRRQAVSGARLGDILRAQGAIGDAGVARAIAAQGGWRFVDLTIEPADPAALAPFSMADREKLLALPALPWRKQGELLWLATPEPEGLAALMEVLEHPPLLYAPVVAPRDHVITALALADPRLWAERAATLTPAPLSARSGPTRGQRNLLLRLLLIILLLAAISPAMAGSIVILWLAIMVLANTVLRLCILAAALWSKPDPAPSAMAEAPAQVVPIASRRGLPIITLLVPLYREAAVLPVLIEALSALDYPVECLEVLLLTEADDTETATALRQYALPPWVEVVVVPPGQPRTKPRAMNVALARARGEILGIYDAEDRPEPDQLRKVVACLAQSGPEVACVQARLGYYNSRENWLTRCFTIEYAIWFDLLLTGLARLRLPIPLGGTSVFFRTGTLRALGGWDAHNVTEDADLGIRLARHGLRCALVDSTTFEEANSEWRSWVRQRSRWIKGYMQTLLVHNRAPRATWRGLGWRGMAGFETLFLAAISSYLAMPLFWLAIGQSLWTGHSFWADFLPANLTTVVVAAFLLGQLVHWLGAVVALLRCRLHWLLPWLLTLPFYWPLGALAGWKALYEMLVRPFYWHKTRHGLGRLAAAARRDALNRHKERARDRRTGTDS